MSECKASASGKAPAHVSYHATALCESDQIGSGTRVWAFAHIMGGARVGADCNICDHVFIESGAVVGDRVTIKNRAVVFNGVTLEDDVFVGPAVVFTNDREPRSPRMPEAACRYTGRSQWLQPTQVERGAAIGAGAVVLCGIRIGAFATVGAGAVVTHDVPAHALVMGQPARPAGWVCVCGSVLNDALKCMQCERVYTRAGDSIRQLESPKPRSSRAHADQRGDAAR